MYPDDGRARRGEVHVPGPDRPNIRSVSIPCGLDGSSSLSGHGDKYVKIMTSQSAALLLSPLGVSMVVGSAVLWPDTWY